MNRKAADAQSPPSTMQMAPLPSLPSEHINHASVFENEMQNRLHGFESGIIALQGEVDGMQQKFEAAIAEQTEKHTTAKADILRRIEDLQKGKRMAVAALDAAALP